MAKAEWNTSQSDLPVADNRAGLSRWRAVPLAVGSIAGSGILFLPSTVYVEAGPNSLLVWVIAIAACLPMLLMFQDMVRSEPDGAGIESFITRGLGAAFGRCVPLMFTALVIVGLPAGAIVAGRYLAHAVGMDAELLGGVVILGLAVGVTLAGTRASSRLQMIGAWALLAMGALLLLFTATAADQGADVLVPDRTATVVVLPAVVLAFWAFAGFENLTLLSREFRNPGRDFLPVSLIALAAYGLFTILLTVAIAIRIPREEVDSVVGLLQLALLIEPTAVSVSVVTVIAMGAMTLNGVAWTWGVSRLIADAAQRGVMPGFLGVKSSAVPHRALGLLSALFAAVLVVLTLVPTIVVDALAAASAIFVLLYLLCIVSYLRVQGLNLRSGLNAVLLLVLAASLVQSGWRSAYGIAVFAIALVVQLAITHRAESRPRRPSKLRP